MNESREIVVAQVEPAAGGALAPWKGLEMVVSPKEALRRVQELQAFVQQVMVREEDYGVIPGTQKPTLYQPGAQKLAELYGFSHKFVVDRCVERWDEPMFFFYAVRCLLVSRTDQRPLAEGLGSCNSREDKYAWRWVGERDLPKGIDKSTLRSKERDGKHGKWTQYRLPNEDVASLVNTIMKMACKRAYVHAVISATRSAGIFTQDAEDLPEEVFGEEAPTRSWESGADDPDNAPDVKDVAKAKAAEARRKKSGEAPEDPEVTKYLGKLAAIGEKGTPADLEALRPELRERWPEKHPSYRRMAKAYREAEAGIAARSGSNDGKPSEKPAAAPEQGKEAAPPAAGTPPASGAAAPAEAPAKPMREPGED